MILQSLRGGIKKSQVGQLQVCDSALKAIIQKHAKRQKTFHFILREGNYTTVL